MVSRNYRIESKRWAKFPAVVLIITGLLWLIRIVFSQQLVPLGSSVDSPVSFIWALLNFIFPLAAIAIAVCLLFLQRWSVWAAGLGPLLPLAVVSLDKVYRIAEKYARYREYQLSAERSPELASGLLESASSAAYDVVMTSLLLIGLWGMYYLILMHLTKTWYWLKRGIAWRTAPLGSAMGTAGDGRGAQLNPDDDDFCLIMPEADEEDD